MDVHLVDGTYELFRQHFGRPEPGPYGAAIGVLSSTLGLFEGGATHVGVASDHIIESFRNDLWPGYKTSAGMPPELLAQLPVYEDALEAMGVTVWPMVEYEADDAMAAAAAIASADERVSQVFLCTPDKDLGQCVMGTRVVQLDRRKGLVIDEDGVRAKFGVGPESIPDYLALVGDSADGYPGIPGWGAKSAAAVLTRYERLEAIPERASQWDVSVRGALTLAANLRDKRDDAFLFRELATLRADAPIPEVLDDLRWRGVPREPFEALITATGADHLRGRVPRWAD